MQRLEQSNEMHVERFKEAIAQISNIGEMACEWNSKVTTSENDARAGFAIVTKGQVFTGVVKAEEDRFWVHVTNTDTGMACMTSKQRFAETTGDISEQMIADIARGVRAIS